MPRIPRKDRRIRRNDDVRVLTGDSAGMEGKVLAINRKKGTVTVEGVNRVWKHMRKSAEHPQGARIQREAPIHISNVQKIVRKKSEKGDGEGDE